MITPPLISAGDSIGIISPARKVGPADIERSLEILEGWGLKVVLSSSIYSNDHGYLGSSDEKRQRDFQEFLDDPSIRAIVSARGGYGSTRILDQLDFALFLKQPKWIVGFSDITAVHLKMASLNVMSVHGTMPLLFSKPDAGPSVESLRDVLMSGTFNLSAHPGRFNRPGQAHGKLVGGNLSLIVDSLSTPSEIETLDCILVIEEIDEPLYRVDRMMTHLKRAGKLDGLRGIAVGHMTDIKDSELPFGETVEQIILNAASSYGFPVGFGLPTGHQNPNIAWIHGAAATLSVSSYGSTLTSSPIHWK